MGLEVKGVAVPRPFSELAPGDAFIYQDTRGAMFCMKGAVAEFRKIVVIGATGGFAQEGAGVMSPEGLGDREVQTLPGAWIELAPGPLGFPESAENLNNGGILIDANGSPWLYARGQAGYEVTFFDLATGEAGKPTDRRGRYNSWNLVWVPPGMDPKRDKTTLYEHRG